MHFNVRADAKAEAHTRIGADARLLEHRGDVTRDKVPVARGKLHVLPRRSKPLLIRLFPSRMRSRFPDDDIGHVQKRVRTGGRSPPSPEAPPVAFEDRYLEKHITPVTLKANIKRNPLFMDTRATEDHRKTKPSWTVREYDTQSIYGNLADYLKKEESTPRDLDFWLEDLYTPGFDSLLKKKEAEHKRRKLCKIASLVILSVCAILIVIIVPLVVLQKRN
uniref:major intrinsically disordered Notch2-binding receptor 1 isoform X1 n=1 Tax=Gasterosteus aculeatus aculeatus TaxID=481459 RepID=UPI001A994424|nr:major intrinsically disordered Notch2-binding receptor 1 isoform X1 [Gasterosteus aculeatus aculeatus]